jgi:hypothetical protein
MMLGKRRLKTSLLVEVGFMLAVWLCAWLIFDAPLVVIIVAIFVAYGVVFFYESWLDSVSKRERASARRSQMRATDPYDLSAQAGRSLSPTSGVSDVSRAQPVPRARSIAERLAAELNERDNTVRKEQGNEAPPEQLAPSAEEVRNEPPAPIPAEKPTLAHREPPKPAPAEKPAPTPRPSLETRYAPDPKRAPAPPQAAGWEPRPKLQPTPPAEMPRPKPASTAQARPELPRREPEPELEEETREPEPRSRLAEIAAGPGARHERRPVGGWNVWQLERMLAAQPRGDQERTYERSLLLVYLREFADSDGQLPPAFDDLVLESFGDLVRGPASP